ncbi:hypothetical protein AB0368_04030 [Actinoplanes sp. NPDC051475]|uniref:hypothetical protein n=1 Tax=Actinoplanes sp. NPDC051475 TaxID=3157225 RepID=UPI00344FF37A
MGSDWIWELRVPVAAEPALRVLYALAAERDLRTIEDPEVTLAAVATGKEHGRLRAGGDVDVFVNWRDGSLSWALNAGFCHRRPAPEADAFREVHARLTGLWLDVAERLNADVGRVLDEWSTEQVWNLGIHEGIHPGGGWPAELGWWTYLGAGRHLPQSPLPEVTARAYRLPNGALVVALLDDPAAVDPLRYADIHARWMRAA